MRLYRLFLLLILSQLTNLSACIIIPIEAGDKEHFEDEKLAFIEIGTTTKDEIAAQMSDFAIEKDEGEAREKLTPQKYRGGDWWLYSQIRQETKWLFAAFAPGGGGAEIIGDVDYRFLLIKFDSDGAVTEYELSSSEGSGCNAHGVCVQQSHYALLAPGDEDQVAKQFDTPGDGCGIYVYSEKKPFSPYFSLPISLDGQQIGWILDKKQFFLFHVDHGAHQLASNRPDLLIHPQVEFDCAGRELMFFELTPRQSGFFSSRYRIELERRDAIIGQEAVGSRQLTLSSD